MSYIKRNLMENEEIIFETKLHWLIFINPLMLMCLTLSFILFFQINVFDIQKYLFNGLNQYIYIFTIFYTFMVTIDFFFTEIAVTNKRVYIKKGIFYINTTEMFFKKIESIELLQNLIDSLINRGHISLVGTGDSRLDIYSISNPKQFKNEILKLLH